MERVLTLVILGVLGWGFFWYSPELRSAIAGGALFGSGAAVANARGPGPPYPSGSRESFYSSRYRKPRSCRRAKKSTTRDRTL